MRFWLTASLSLNERKGWKIHYTCAVKIYYPAYGGKMGFIFVGIACFISAAVMMLMEIGIKSFVILFFIVILLSARR